MKEIHLVNLAKCPTYIHKYMPSSRVLNTLENYPHTIGFVYPELWYDPYEIKYLNTDYTGLNGYKQPKIYCLCARTDNINEEASWKIYQRDNDPLLRLFIQSELFVSNIMKFAEANECDVYLSKINYDLSRSEIDNLYSLSSPHYHNYFQKFNDEQYVKVMSLKRKAFSYENEVRFFIIPSDHDKIKNYITNNVLNVPIDIHAIKRITYYPAHKTDESLASKIEHAKYEAEQKLIRERIMNAHPDVKFVKSTLYKATTGINKIEV